MRLFFLLSILFFTTPSFALDVPPRPLGYVSDFAGILSAGDKQQIESVLRAHEQTTSNQIAVAIFNSLEEQSLEDFSIKLAEAWKIGQKGKDNGVILLVFITDRKLRIEVGYGLEPYLTDALSDQIIRDVIVPNFKVGDYAGGILQGAKSIIAVINNDQTALPSPPARHARGQNANNGNLIFTLLFIGFLIDFLRYTFYFIKNKSYTNRYNVLEWFFRFSLLLFILKILASSRGGGGSSRSSGGGFSGGGGSFGGGGASGRW